MVAHYTVDPGQPVLISSADIKLSGDGSEEPSLQTVLKVSKVREGQILRHDEYEQTKGALLAAALEHGYRDAQFTESRIEVDPAARSARIVLHLATGPRYRFSDLTFDRTSCARVPAALRALRAR